MSERNGLDGRLQRRVLERLGLGTPPAPDLDGLRALYRAWCASVPFDNVRKMIALRSGDGRRLPGVEPDDFLGSWLEHVTGGTCWPTSSALHALARSLGFDAARITAHMLDLGMVNHASVRVALRDGDDRPDWLIDSSLLTNEPLPLGAGVFLGDDPVLPTEVEAEDGTHVIWCHTPPNSRYLPCRLVPGTVDHDFYVAAYERSRERSAFNDRLYARRNRPGKLIVLRGNARFARTRAGVETRDLSRDEVLEALRNDIGLSAAIVDEWAASGALEASFLPPSGPKPPPVERLPPSQRATG